MQQFNSFYGCTKCLQKAKSFKTSQLKLMCTVNEAAKDTIENQLENHSEIPCQQNKRDGTVRLFTYSEDLKLKRTEENYQQDLNLTIENISNKVKDPEVRGVKGPCILSTLKYFHPIRSHCIDYMHTVLEGVMKNFFKYWFDSAFTKAPLSLRKYMKEIDNRLSLIKPPKFVPSTPRSIHSYIFWSAHEYLSFFCIMHCLFSRISCLTSDTKTLKSWFYFLKQYCLEKSMLNV